MKPEEFIGPKVYYDDHGQMIFSDRGKEKGVQLLLDVRGWGAIQNLPIENPDQFQDDMGQWIAKAINEKLTGELKSLYERRGYIRGKLHTFFLCDEQINLNDLEYQAYESDLKEVERQIKELEF